MKPNITGINIEGRRGGGVCIGGDPDKEIAVGEDKRWIHRHMELPGLDGTDPVGWTAQTK